MDIESKNQKDKTLVLRYIDGKSYKWLKQFLIREGFNESETVKKLSQLDIQYKNQRFKRANRDLLIALIFIVIPLGNFLLFYFDILIVKFGIIEIACVFAFRPFLLSYFRVMRDKTKF